jgi:pimeloyl-ACP methyl ester carboxylesterase
VVKATAITLAFGLLIGLAVWNGIFERLIFQPSPGVDLRPEALGIEAEEVFLQAEDGVRLHAFFLPTPGASRALLFLHGNAGNASHRLPNAAGLAQLGTHVLLPDYRGYGLSEGTPSEAGVYADARASLAYLLGERGFAENRTVVFGRSLGGAVAVDLARDRDTIARPLAPLIGGALASDAKIGRVRAPLLFFHGDRDEIVNYRLGRGLFEAAPEPKAFETIRGAGHNDTVEVGGRAYFERIRRFLDEVAP